ARRQQQQCRRQQQQQRHSAVHDPWVSAARHQRGGAQCGAAASRQCEWAAASGGRYVARTRQCGDQHPVEGQGGVPALPLASRREEARQQAAALLAAADPLLRRAYAHVHNCKCDVAGAVQALVRG
ncbi:hypothetical protein Agub_g1712, partial [Astrephomene gubernaculifera]